MITITDKKTFGAKEVFTVNIGGVSISNCQYKSGTSAKGDYEFIALPQHKITTKSGEDKWISDTRITRELADQLLIAYKESIGIVTDGTPDFDPDEDIPF